MTAVSGQVAQRRRERVGKAAEDRVSKVLGDVSGAILLRNLYIPGKSGATAEIDAVLLSRGGVFLIEVKGVSGKVRGSASRYEWRSMQGKRRVAFYNPIKQCAAHAEALSRYLALKGDQKAATHSIVVFASPAVAFEKVPPNTRECTVADLRHLRPLLQRKMNARKDVFTRAELAEMEKSLVKTACVSEQTRRAHVRHARQAMESRAAKRRRSR